MVEASVFVGLLVFSFRRWMSFQSVKWLNWGVWSALDCLSCSVSMSVVIFVVDVFLSPLVLFLICLGFRGFFSSFHLYLSAWTPVRICPLSVAFSYSYYPLRLSSSLQMTTIRSSLKMLTFFTCAACTRTSLCCCCCMDLMLSQYNTWKSTWHMLVLSSYF